MTGRMEPTAPKSLPRTVSSMEPTAYTVTVPIDRVGTPFPLRDRVDHVHVARLVEAFDSLPPIVLRAADLRIIDGHLRWLAARFVACELGAAPPVVTAVLLDIDEVEARRERLRRNAHHGLPLTSAERRAAALRLLAETDWSDRLIAERCGTSHQTVGRLRRAMQEASGGPTDHQASRTGRDGKTYPAVTVADRREPAQASPERSSGWVSKLVQSLDRVQRWLMRLRRVVVRPRRRTFEG